MKKVYFSGKFNKLKDPKLSLSDSLKDDYRSKILGGSEKLTHPIDTQIVFGKYIYTGPFYCEQASSGDYTSTDCNTVLNAEFKAISDADFFVCVLSEHFSVGTIVELDWALYQNKEIILLYQEEESSYTIKSEYWFAIANAIKNSHHIKIIPFKNTNDIYPLIKNLL